MKELQMHSVIGCIVGLCLALALTGCPGPQGPQGPEGPEGPEGPAGPQGPGVSIDPGINVEVLGVTVPEDMRVEVSLALTDDAGVAVPIDEFTSSGVRMTIARTKDPDAKQDAVPELTNYIVETLETNFVGYATEYDTRTAVADGALTQNEDGTYLYKFVHALLTEPEEGNLSAVYDPAAIHQIAGQFQRVASIDGNEYVANMWYNWIPETGVETEIPRDIVVTDICNSCHTQLQLHGSRREIQYCLTCHTDQAVDPDTGNSVFMPYMIHQIHMGPNLPSGEAYEIIGYRDSVHNYSNVHMPQDITNCTMCHVDGADSDNWKNNPTMDACGACHDTVDFSGGGTHPAQADDSLCSVCHTPEQISNHIFDPVKMVLTLDETNGIAVDGSGIVTINFSAADSDGNAITDLDADGYTVGFLIGWPAQEYLDNVGDSSIGADLTNNGDGTYSYTATAAEAIPTGTAMTFGFNWRGRSVDEAGNRIPMVAADTVYFTTDGGAPMARRTVVDDAACAACHGEPFAGHGSDRIGVQNCLICHDTQLVSEPDEGEPVTVNLKDMIHKIHRGADLESGYTTGGHYGDVDFTNVHFPGLENSCTICHGDHDISLPLPAEALPTVVEVDGTVLSTIPPETAACTSCHDSLMARVHATLNTDGEGNESCAVCHGPGSYVDAEVAHEFN